MAETVTAYISNADLAAGALIFVDGRVRLRTTCTMADGHANLHPKHSIDMPYTFQQLEDLGILNHGQVKNLEKILEDIRIGIRSDVDLSPP